MTQVELHYLLPVHADSLRPILPTKLADLVITAREFDVVRGDIEGHAWVHHSPLLATVAHAAHVLSAYAPFDTLGQAGHPNVIVPAIAALPLLFALEVLAIFHVDRLPTLVVDWSEPLHLVVGEPVHGNVLALDVGVGGHVHLVFPLGLLGEELLFPVVLVTRL